MKDVTSTSFGLVIGFLLPGLAFFYSLSFWSPSIDRLFTTFLTIQSNVGLFLLVLATATILGLQITLIRWFFYEVCICRPHCLNSSFFNQLGMSADRLSAFRAVVDEHYRYHQFWGCMSVVIPIFGIGWLFKTWPSLVWWKIFCAITGLILIELLTGWAAVVAYRLYSTRAQQILAGGQPCQTVGEDVSRRSDRPKKLQ